MPTLGIIVRECQYDKCPAATHLLQQHPLFPHDLDKLDTVVIIRRMGGSNTGRGAELSVIESQEPILTSSRYSVLVLRDCEQEEMRQEELLVATAYCEEQFNTQA